MIYLVGRLLQLEQSADADDRKGDRAKDDGGAGGRASGTWQWKLAAAGSSWQLAA